MCVISYAQKAEDVVLARVFAGSGNLKEAMPEVVATDIVRVPWLDARRAGAGRLLQGWRRRVVLLIVASFVLLDAYGLCRLGTRSWTTTWPTSRAASGKRAG